MKNIYTYYLLVLLIALGMNSCDDYDVAVGGDPKIEVNVSLSPDEHLEFAPTEGSTIISVITNMKDEDISIYLEPHKDAWCTAELKGREIKVTVTENIKYASRSTKLTVKVFNVIKIITIDQEEKVYVEEPIYPIEGVYKIDVPSLASFNESKIYKAMDGEQKIAEICLEYLNSGLTSTRAIVAYVGTGGTADYSAGVVAAIVDQDGNISSTPNAGGRVNFDIFEHSLEYTAGESPAGNAIYVSGFGVTLEEPESEGESPIKEIQAEPYLVRDRDGNSYPIVKVGCEVWLGSNLRATKLEGNEDIPVVEKAQIPEYKDDRFFVTYPRGDSSIDLSTFGYLYGSATVKGDYEDLLGRTIIDGNWRVATGGGNNSGVMGQYTDWQRLFKYIGANQLGAILATGYQWNGGGGGEFDPSTVTNITGLSIVAAGEMYGIDSDNPFVIGGTNQAFFFHGGGGAYGYNLAEKDGKVADMAGVRTWGHNNDACSVRLVRADQREY